MAFLERFGWATQDANRGEYASVEDREHLVSKEGEDASLQEQHRALLESHRKLKLWLRGLCIAFGLVLVVLVLAVLNTKQSPSKSSVLTPVPESTLPTSPHPQRS